MSIFSVYILVFSGRDLELLRSGQRNEAGVFGCFWQDKSDRRNIYIWRLSPILFYKWIAHLEIPKR